MWYLRDTKLQKCEKELEAVSHEFLILDWFQNQQLSHESMVINKFFVLWVVLGLV